MQGAGFPDTERRNWSVSFLCFSYIKGTLLMHLTVSVTYLKLSSVCDPPESMAKVGPLRLLSLSVFPTFSEGSAWKGPISSPCELIFLGKEA